MHSPGEGPGGRSNPKSPPPNAVFRASYTRSRRSGKRKSVGMVLAVRPLGTLDEAIGDWPLVIVPDSSSDAE